MPTTQAVPKMTNCTIASYGKGCPGSVIAHEMPPAVATSVPQRSHRARVWSATVANAMAFAIGSGA